MFTPIIFKTQKSTLGYNYGAIKKRIRTCETIGGILKEYIILPTSLGNRHFDILHADVNFIIMQSGLVQYRIEK